MSRQPWDEAPLEEARALDQICTRFEQAWKATEHSAPPPPVEDFLPEGAESFRSLVREELALLDAEYRTKRADSFVAAAPPATMRLSGRFELLNQVGAGAFGSVWRARDAKLERVVALKIPHAGLLAVPANLERFYREARAVARLRHPGIVTVHEVLTLEDVVGHADIFVTATGNKDVITVDHMRAMKDMAIVCNIGHFDNEIQVASLRNFKWTNVKPQVDMIEFADGKRMLLLSEGRLVNLGNATGHPSFVMSASFTNQVLAQIELFNAPAGTYEKQVYTLPKALDEKVAALHLAKVGAKLTKLTPQQAEYIGVSPSGPFKHDLYRY